MRSNRGAQIGAVVGAVFGGLWLYYGATLFLPAYRTGAVVSSMFLTLVIAIIGWRGRSTRIAGRVARIDAGQARRHYSIVVIAEVVAMNIAANALHSMHHLEYMVAAAAIIVGVHFIPLARIFRYPAYYFTAAGMTASGIVALMPAFAAFTCLCCAISLWATVLYLAANKLASPASANI